MTSRKRKAEENVEDNNNDEEEDHYPETPTKDLKNKKPSPDGMKLRSGRKKKRKKSTEEFPVQAQKKARTQKRAAETHDSNNNNNKKSSSASNNDDDMSSASENNDDEEDDEDESMQQEDEQEEEDQEEEEEEDDDKPKNGKVAKDKEADETSSLDQKPAAAAAPAVAANGTHHATAATTTTTTTTTTRATRARTAAKTGLSVIDKLKLPSQHTPGRQLNETARLPDREEEEEEKDMAAAVAAAAAAIQPMHLDKRMATTKSTTATATTKTTVMEQREVVRPVVAQQQQQQPQANHEEEEEDLYLRRDERLLAAADEEQQQQQEEAEAILDRLCRTASEGLSMLLESTQQMIAPMHYQHADNDADAVGAVGDDDNNEDVRIVDHDRDVNDKDMLQHLEKTWVWVLILLAFVVATQMLVHPILSSVVSLARVVIPFYKGLLLSGDVVNKSSTTTTTITTTPAHLLVDTITPSEISESSSLIVNKAQILMQRSNAYRDELVAARDTLFRDLASLDQTAIQQQPVVVHEEEDEEEETSAMQASSSDMNENELLLTKQVADMEAILTKHKTMTPKALAAIREVVGEELADTYLLDVFAFDMQQTVSTAIGGASSSLSREREQCGLQRTVALKTMRELKLEILRETDAIQADSSMVDAVVEWTLTNIGNIDKSSTKVDSDHRHKATGSSLDGIRKVIGARLEVELADRTGAVDYASLYNGAAIIRVGDYATTPSLVDRLPYVNRLFKTLGLRFYGHGPEAALTPTFPPDALGQCWSFEKDPMPVPTPLSGRFATLSVRLANPLYITSVSIEHPPREITSRRNSAIRRFRVLGFKSPDASGEAWQIGSFEYQVGGDIIQVFETEDEVDDDEVPPLRSISLAIDGAWGPDYACLYRLRVHGEEVKE